MQIDANLEKARINALRRPDLIGERMFAAILSLTTKLAEKALRRQFWRKNRPPLSTYSLDLLSQKKTVLYCTKTSQSKSRHAAITPLFCASNVVGYYQNLETETANYTMVAPTFLTTAESDGTFCMNDIKVTPKEGTKAPSIKIGTSSSGGIGAGDFVVQFLDNIGKPSAQYTWLWYAEGTKTSYVTKTKLQIKDTSTKSWRDCEESELAYIVPAGKGMWVQGGGHTLNIPAPEGL